MTATVTPIYPPDYLERLAHDDAPEARASFALTVRTDLEIESMPPLSWLADRVLPRGGLAALYGPPGSAKSFIALDLAFAVATGTQWLGRDVVCGGALYLAAEGLGGLGQRVRAWKEFRGFAGQDLGVGFVTQAVNLLDPMAATRVSDAAASLGRTPELIVIDTLARSMIGDENNTGDMSRLIATMDAVRETTGALVMAAHHTKKDSELERGSSALRGGVDTLILCQEGDDGRQLICQKQKDAEAFAPIHFSLVAGHGSCVVTSTGGESPAGLTGPGSHLTPQRLKALTTLVRGFTASGASATEWLKASDISERTFYNVRTWLVEEGYVSEIRRRYTPTPSGRGAVATAITAKSLPNPLPSPYGNPLKGVSGVAAPNRNGSTNGSKHSRNDGTNESEYWLELEAEVDERIGIREDL